MVTLVPGKREALGEQQPAILKVSAELKNTTAKPVTGNLVYTIGGQKVIKQVTLKANSTNEINFPELSFANPKLWWPAGYGKQDLYAMKISFLEKGTKLVIVRL